MKVHFVCRLVIGRCFVIKTLPATKAWLFYKLVSLSLFLSSTQLYSCETTFAELSTRKNQTNSYSFATHISPTKFAEQKYGNGRALTSRHIDAIFVNSFLDFAASRNNEIVLSLCSQFRSRKRKEKKEKKKNRQRRKNGSRAIGKETKEELINTSTVAWMNNK